MHLALAAGDGHDHRIKLAALTLVNGDGVGKLQLGSHLEQVLRQPVVKAHLHRFGGSVDRLNKADVPVVDTHPLLAVLLLPEDVVVVFNLHHLVPHPKGATVVFKLRLLGRRCAHCSHAGWHNHLNVRRRGIPVAFGQTGSHQVDDGRTHLIGTFPPQEEKVAVVPLEVRHLSADNGVGVGNNQALLRLPEDFGQTHLRHLFRLNQVSQHIARTDRRQLVAVAHQNQTAVHLQRTNQRAHQRDVHHRSFVHNDCIGSQRVLFVSLKL